jgi:hypothetical protein
VTSPSDLQLRVLLAQARFDVVASRVLALDPARRKRVLGSHLIHSYEGEDCEIRDELDTTVCMLGLVELGIMLGAVGLPGEEVRRFLRQPDVARYAFQYYPQLLPRLLLDRLEGSPICAPGSWSDEQLFFEVHALEARKHHAELGAFLLIVDDYSVGVMNLGDFLDRLQSPDKVLKALTAGTAKRPEFRTALFGLFEFLRWSSDLHALLGRVHDAPARSAAWHHFGYWFGLVGGQLYGALAASLVALGDVFESWRESAPASPAASVVNDIDLHLRQLGELTSHMHGAPLEQLAFASRRWEATAVPTAFQENSDARGIPVKASSKAPIRAAADEARSPRMVGRVSRVTDDGYFVSIPPRHFDPGLAYPGTVHPAPAIAAGLGVGNVVTLTVLESASPSLYGYYDASSESVLDPDWTRKGGSEA